MSRWVLAVPQQWCGVYPSTLHVGMLIGPPCSWCGTFVCCSHNSTPTRCLPFLGGGWVPVWFGAFLYLAICHLVLMSLWLGVVPRGVTDFGKLVSCLWQINLPCAANIMGFKSSCAHVDGCAGLHAVCPRAHFLGNACSAVYSNSR